MEDSLSKYSKPPDTHKGVSYYVKEERLLFSGDVLFQGSVGRTDLIGGSEAVLLNSIETKLLTLSDDAIVFMVMGLSRPFWMKRILIPF